MLKGIPLVVIAGLINWLVTLIVVEAAILTEARNCVRSFGERVKNDSSHCGATRFLGGKIAYLVGCHLCVGVWVGFFEAVILDAAGFSPFQLHAWLWNVGFGTFAYKAIGHLTLQISNCLHQKGELLKAQSQVVSAEAELNQLLRQGADEHATEGAH